MRSNKIILLLLVAGVVSCSKNETVFYKDDRSEPLAVFSDDGNNVMSCYLNGKPFVTVERKLYYGLLSTGSQELSIKLLAFQSMDSDTLRISWYSRYSSIDMVLAIKKEFRVGDLNDFSGERISLDGTNGYFKYDGQKGTGHVYFHTIMVDRNDDIGIRGRISGLFEATGASFQITKGRFDHSLNDRILTF
ncbi:MAG: hypothetical protein KIT80_09515 [Chitinophagaceae bacterium]|nr:hypothetical protein [Chitinophagaceae bacterium]MCW5927137.1 hypothetical protein [Chitinophagaceae bacterium]